MNFDTKEYRTLLQRIIDMPEVKYAEWGVLYRFFMAFDPLFYPFTELDWKDGYTQYTSLPPLLLSETQPLRVKSDLFYRCIAQDAQSPELALDYFSFLAEFQYMYQPEIGFMMTGGATQLTGIDVRNPSFHSMPLVGMTSEGLSILPHEAPGGFISKESLDFYRSIFPALDFYIWGINPAYTWGEPDMCLP